MTAATAIRVKFRHPVTHRIVCVTCDTEAQAGMVKARIRDIRLKLRINGPAYEETAVRELSLVGPKRPSRRTLRDAARSWGRNVAPSTREKTEASLDRGLLSSLAAVELERLDAKRLADWVEALRREVCDATILREWRVLSAIVRAAVSHRQISFLPWGAWRPPRSLDPTPKARDCARTPEQVRALLDAAQELDQESRQPIPDLHARIACALLLGLRVGEIAGLRWSDFDREAALVRIERQYDDQPTKKRTTSTVSVPSELWPILDELAARLDRCELLTPDGPVFPSRFKSWAKRPRHADRANLTTPHVRRVVQRAGINGAERWTVHSLRASFVCLELAASRSLAHAMLRARHKTIRATQAYARGLLDQSPPPAAWQLPPSPPKALPE